MPEREPKVQAFLDSLRESFRVSRSSEETARCVDDVFLLLDGRTGTPGTGSRRFPACASLPDALRRVAGARPDLAGTAHAFEALEPSLAWSQRNGGASASANFMEGHANAMIVGPGGLEHRDDVWVGASLLSPRVRYPDHQHGPEEVYLALSEGEFRQGDGPWFAPGLGGTFFNVPDFVHAMRSGAAPLFAIWCLRPNGTPVVSTDAVSS